MKQMSSNPKMLKAMSDPNFSQAIDLMAKNPKEALEKYGSNPDFVEIITEFSKFMCTHFEKIGK